MIVYLLAFRLHVFAQNRGNFFFRDVHKLLSDPMLAQHINNVSSLKSDQLKPDAEAMRRQHLEQQQEQFNREIGQVTCE